MNIDQALAIIGHARQRAAQIEATMSFSVVDTGGRVVAVARMDGAPFFTTDIATSKACTAAATGATTAALTTALRDAVSFAVGAAVSTGGQFMLAGGGVPITEEGRLVGGLGASGGSEEQDADVAEAAVAAVALGEARS